MKLYVFWTVPLSIIQSFPLYDCVYSEKLLMMGRETV